MPDIDKIIAFESGELSSNEVLDLFADMITSGVVWHLQGVYGRVANDLIGHGWISPEGDVLRYDDDV